MFTLELLGILVYNIVYILVIIAFAYEVSNFISTSVTCCMERSIYMKKNYFNLIGTLPPALSEQEIAELLAIDNEESRKTLIKHNLRLVMYIAKKFTNLPTHIEDFISIGTIGLIKAIHTFDITKGVKLSSYLSRCIENEILMYIRHENKWKNYISLNSRFFIDDEGSEIILSDTIFDAHSYLAFEMFENRELINFALTYALNFLSFKECFVFFYSIGKKTQEETKMKLGISQSYVSKIRVKIRNKIQNALNTDRKIPKNQRFIFFMEDISYCFGLSKKFFPNCYEILIQFLSDESHKFSFNLTYAYFEDSTYAIIKFPMDDEAFVAIAEIVRYITTQQN